jgi:hypothetical protein
VAAEQVTVIGWNNDVPEGTTIGEGATVYPHLVAEQWPDTKNVEAGEVLK